MGKDLETSDRDVLHEICQRYAYRPVRLEVDAILAAGFNRTARDEPSDEQVLAAFEEYQRVVPGRRTALDSMRAALLRYEALKQS